MAVVQRADSKFWWMNLEGANGGRSKRLSTGIPIGDGPAFKASKAEAEAVYRARMGDIARNREGIATELPARTFREQADWYLANVVPAQKADGSKAAILRMIAHFGNAPLLSITPEQIAEWKAERRRTCKASSVNRYLCILKPLLRSAVPKYLHVSPADDRAAGKLYRVDSFPPVTTIDDLDPNAEARILAVASPHERALYLLGVDTLARAGDCRTLRRRDDHGSHLTFPDPKTGKHYSVPVSPRLRAALDALPNDGPHYFHARSVAPHNPRVADRVLDRQLMIDVFMRLCKRAGLTYGRKRGGITLHGLRHTGATRATSKGVGLPALMALGNWATLDMVRRYSHPTGADLLAAVALISGARPVHGAAPRAKRTNKTGLKLAS